MRQVITLSTIPPRFDQIGIVLRCLLAQRRRPEAIELYIPGTYRRFPQWGGALPEVPEGVTIVRVDVDLGPATKILPAAKAWRGQDIDLIYVDDDRQYGPNLTQIFSDLRKAHPGVAICGHGFSLRERYGYDVPERPTPRMLSGQHEQVTAQYQWRRLLGMLKKAITGRPLPKLPTKLIAQSGYTDIAEGFGGVMVRPDFFDDMAYDIPPVLWSVDDFWLSGMLARRGIPIWADRRLEGFENIPEVWTVDALFDQVIDGADRHQANRACVDYMRATYGIWGGTAVKEP